MDEIDDGYSGLSGVGIFASSLPGCSLEIAILRSMITHAEQLLHFIFNALAAAHMRLRGAQLPVCHGNGLHSRNPQKACSGLGIFRSIVFSPI